MQRPLCWLTFVCSCYAEIGGTAGDASPAVDPLPRRTYYEACDGSAVAIDADRFVVLADDDSMARVYARGEGRPVASYEVTLGIEDAARIGDRIYAIGSYSRDANGTLDQIRSRFVAISSDLVPVGQSLTLLSDLVDAASWETPDAAIIESIRTAAALTPDAGGISIEGLAFSPTPEHNARTWIGFRSPLVENRAVAISLLDPAATIAGARARFGGAALLDLGGYGIRGMAYSDALSSIMIVAGPIAPARFRIFRWSGSAIDAPTAVIDFDAPDPRAVAEAIVTYPQSPDLQIVFDMSDAMVTDIEPCRHVAPANRSFQDVIVRVD